MSIALADKKEVRHQVCVRLEPKLFDQIKVLANKEEKPLSAIARKLIKLALEAK